MISPEVLRVVAKGLKWSYWMTHTSGDYPRSTLYFFCRKDAPDVALSLPDLAAACKKVLREAETLYCSGHDGDQMAWACISLNENRTWRHVLEDQVDDDHALILAFVQWASQQEEKAG